MANAITLSLTSRPRSASQMQRKRNIDMNGSFGHGSMLLDNLGDRFYFVNITLGGSQVEVTIDTGRCIYMLYRGLMNILHRMAHFPDFIAQICGFRTMSRTQEILESLQRSIMVLDLLTVGS